VQQVAHGRGGCNSRLALTVSREMTSMFHLYFENSSPVFRFRMLSGEPQWIDFFPGAPE